MAPDVPPSPSKQGSGVSQKALKVLGTTEEEVQFEHAWIVRNARPPSPGAQSMWVQMELDEDSFTEKRGKGERTLGAPHSLEWLRERRSSETVGMSQRVMRSKALARLGATIDDVRIEKALLVLGEAPGREVPAGPVARPPQRYEELWAVPPPVPERRPPVFLLAFLPWGVLAPLNVMKLQLNRVSPMAAHFVPYATETCQAECGIARMWATLFWSMQFASAISCLYLHYHRERGLALLALSNKLVVGALLLKAYTQGVILWPIGLFGAGLEWIFALLFTNELLAYK